MRCADARPHRAYGTATFSIRSAGQTGFNLPDDFGASPIAPAAIPDMDRESPPGFRFSVFSQLEVRGVAYNYLIEGDTPTEGQDLDIEHWVGDFVLGASLHISDRVSIDYMLVTRSEEFEGQDGDQHFGSLSLSYTWPPTDDEQ